MAIIKNMGSFGVTDTFKLNEGAVSMATVSGVGGDITKPKFATPAAKGLFVKITGDWTVTPCGAGDAYHGILVSNPKMVEEPTVAGDFGTYEPRIGSVQCDGKVIKTVKLEAANSAISAGDYIKVGATTAQCFEKGTSSNAVGIAIESATASSGAKIAVLFK